jgi:hypothetical protein
MRFLDDSGQYDFSPGRYERQELGDLDFTVETVDDTTRMREIVEGTGSCLNDTGSQLDRYLDTFSSSETVHFYDLEGQGYARSVELPTSRGEALAVDAVKTEGSLDTEVFRAGVNCIFRHADAMNKDLVLGGKEFFMNGPKGPMNLTYDSGGFNPATTAFFDETVSERDLKVHHKEKDYTKGEQWDEHEEYFVRWL